MTQNQTLTHLDANGDIAMVDVSTKTATTRTATATGQVIFPADIYTAIKNADGMTKKGSITQTTSTLTVTFHVTLMLIEGLRVLFTH